jgi:small subunit ribosomal protein S17
MARQYKGVVSSISGAKSIIVSVETKRAHKLYKKQYTTINKYHTHDEKEQAKLGDLVTIQECRPKSAKKRHELVEVIENKSLIEVDLVDETDQSGDEE